MKALSDDTQINLSFRYVLMLIGVSASFAFGYGKLMGDINDLKFLYDCDYVIINYENSKNGKTFGLLMVNCHLIESKQQR